MPQEALAQPLTPTEITARAAQAQLTVAQLVSDILILSRTHRTPVGERVASQKFGAFADWVAAEAAAGRPVNFEAIMANPCRSRTEFCPVRGQ